MPFKDQLPYADAAPRLSGEPQALLAELGSAASLEEATLIGAGLLGRGIDSPAKLKVFLAEYREKVLAPLELPAICRAYQHAERYQVRELIELDQSLMREPLLIPFAEASRCIGRSQLRRLRPMRDLKLIKHYLAAIETGVAQGWHTTVFGIVLATYGLALRPGLIHFAEQTLRGFVFSSACPLRLTEADRAALLEEAARGIAELAHQAIERHESPRFQLL